MFFTLTNKSRALLTVPLRGGDYLHLAPGEASQPLHEREVRDHAPLLRLVQRKSVALTQAEGSKAAQRAKAPRGQGSEQA